MGEKNQSLKIYLQSPFVDVEKYYKNIKILQQLGHTVTNEYFSYITESELALEEIKNSDIILFDITDFPVFCFKNWIYSSVVLELKKEVWVICSETLRDSTGVNSIFKDWTEVYSELHPI